MKKIFKIKKSIKNNIFSLVIKDNIYDTLINILNINEILKTLLFVT